MTPETTELSFMGKIQKSVGAMRPTEKLVFGIISIVFIASILYVLQWLNLSYSTEIPAHGGTYKEGVVGYPRFINPVLSFTDADKDMSALIYSGLLKPTPEGKLAPDLAESYTVSEDGLTYSFTLKPNITFHDGKPVTTDDITFTIEKIINPAIKSPKAESWNGVSVSVTDERHISFTLKKPYAPFLENLTIGILPKHVWQDITDDTFDISVANREPVGSGPFMIKKSSKDSAGIYESYDLVPFAHYALGEPYISHFVVHFYKNDADALDAYKRGRIDGLGGISPDAAAILKKSGDYIVSTPLPRVFAVFFNQSVAPVLVHKEVRQALNISINRNELIKEVLKDWGTPGRSPIPSGLSGTYDITSSSKETATTTTSDSLLVSAKKILTDAGWKTGTNGFLVKEKIQNKKVVSTETLSFTISAPNIPELIKTANIVKETWGKLGADVKVQIFEPTDLTQKVIRPRSYDALLFGQVVGRDLDLYPFWHSSQRNDPGLNIALYTSIKADKDLETARAASDDAKRAAAYQAFESEIADDIPAVFLYSPDYVYAGNKNVGGVRISNITSPSERFMGAATWYADTDRVWNIFLKK